MSKLQNRRALGWGRAFIMLLLPLGSFIGDAKADGTEISLQPRFWYNFYGDGQYNNSHKTVGTFMGSEIHSQSASPAYELPFYGGTVALKTPVIGPGTLAVTVLNGSAKSDGTEIWYGTLPEGDGGAKQYYTDMKTKDSVRRLDIEAMYILPIGATTSLLMGGRYIGFDWKRRLTTDTDLDVETKTEANESYYGELGIGFAAPLTTNSRHVFFANLTGMLGYLESDITYTNTTLFHSEGNKAGSHAISGGIDANVGYAYNVTDNLKMSARYRLFVRSEIDHWSENGSELMHGPEFGLTYTFRSHDPLK